MKDIDHNIVQYGAGLLAFDQEMGNSLLRAIGTAPACVGTLYLVRPAVDSDRQGCATLLLLLLRVHRREAPSDPIPARMFLASKPGTCRGPGW